MKKLLVILAVGLTGVFAHAQEPVMSTMDNDIHADGRVWVCGMKFKGTAKGFKIIAGHFKSEADGVISCTNIHGTKWSKNVRIAFGAHCLSPTVGIGYLKYYGISGELSLFNSDPEVILGKYLALNADAAVIFGVGTFRAVKVGMPQLAFNMSIQLEKGLGVSVGLDHLYISEKPNEEVKPN
ncbi:MAG: hypothetical protein ACM3MG_08460 [Bacillota bacterium]